MRKLLRFLGLYKFHILMALALVLLVAMYVDFSSVLPHKEVVELIDNCGLLPSNGGLQHSIPDEGACSSQCLGLCNSRDFDKVEYEFEFGTEEENSLCNKCVCTCH